MHCRFTVHFSTLFSTTRSSFRKLWLCSRADLTTLGFRKQRKRMPRPESIIEARLRLSSESLHKSLHKGMCCMSQELLQSLSKSASHSSQTKSRPARIANYRTCFGHYRVSATPKNPNYGGDAMTGLDCSSCLMILFATKLSIVLSLNLAINTPSHGQFTEEVAAVRSYPPEKNPRWQPLLDNGRLRFYN